MSRVAFEATTGNLVVPAELRSDPRRLQQAVCSDAALLDQLLQRNPTLAEAALSDSPDLLAALLGDARDGEAAARRDDPGRERRIAAANASLARLDRHHPELNVPVDAAKLPHAPCCLNGVALEAYVDTGCQASLVTPEGARRCGLDGEVDPRVGGAIGGIGSAPIVGKVHLTTVAIGGATLPISLLVVEQAIAPFVLGIDVLARHSAVIDLDSAAPSLRIAGAQVPLVLR